MTDEIVVLRARRFYDIDERLATYSDRYARELEPLHREWNDAFTSFLNVISQEEFPVLRFKSWQHPHKRTVESQYEWARRIAEEVLTAP